MVALTIDSDFTPEELQEKSTASSQKLQADVVGKIAEGFSQHNGSPYESSETVSATIDVAYLDELAATPGLHPKHIEQLNNMKKLLATNPNCTIKKDRLKVREDGVLLIDGFTVPFDLVDHSDKPGYENEKKGKQLYEDMNEKGSEFLYTDGVFAMLDFVAEMGGKKFDKGTLNSTNMRNKSLSREIIRQQLQSGDNNAILGDLIKILNLEGRFPIGLDKDGYIIYASVRSDDIGFYVGAYRIVISDCLASLNGNKTPLNGGVSQ